MTSTESSFEISNTRRPISQFRSDESQLGHDLFEYLKNYAAKTRSRSLWCFGIGFILGWKLKPW